MSAAGSDPATSASPPTLTNGVASAERNRTFTRRGLSAWRGNLPRVEEDRPSDDVFGNQDPGFHPRIFAKQTLRLGRVVQVHDDERPALVPVRPGENDPPLLEQPVHERSMLIPERLLPRRHSGHPRRPRLPMNEEKGVAR